MGRASCRERRQTKLGGAGGASSGPSFKADTYSLSESGPSDYTASPYSCVKNGVPAVSGNSITLANGDTATCTITNDDKAPSLTLVKHVTNDNGGTRTAAEWTLSARGSGGSPTNLSGAGGARSGGRFKARTDERRERGR